jgi:hypothetical protein
MGSSILSIPNSYAQEDTQIPNWIKNTAGWWANDEISEIEFLTGIEYLINNNIISISFTPCVAKIENQHSSSTNLIPDWVKNNAGWWAADQIEDDDFINGIEYLIKKQIISIDAKKIQGNVELEDVIFSPAWNPSIDNLVTVSSVFFEIYGAYGDCIESSNGNLIWYNLLLGLNPNKMDMYNEVAVWNDPQKVVVVYPYFTNTAYAEPGFYTYYRGGCDDCTTTKFAHPTVLYTSSGIGHQALTLLGYPSITDIEIDKNPDILQQFDKVIILHNEYVTRAMFDAITNHPNVIYLYPNALYAEIEVDYIDQTITLVRGHNYPESKIENGFDWEFDNTHPYEYDSNCLEMQFYKIRNGWMTNCYPENVFLEMSKTKILLKAIKDI